MAPAGQSQTDMVLRTIKDLIAKDAVTPELEKETGHVACSRWNSSSRSTRR